MKKIITVISLIIVIAMCVEANAVNVDVYTGHSVFGDGSPYSGLVGSFISPDILFATNTGYNWHPFGLAAFGAEITGFFNVAADNPYTFTLNSDDGSILSIDGALVVDNGGAHAPVVASGTAVLTAGIHSFRVGFFEDFGGPSGVDLILPNGVSFTSGGEVPEPTTMLLLGSGLLGLAGYGRKKFFKK